MGDLAKSDSGSTNNNGYTNSATSATQANYITKGTYSDASNNTGLTSVGKTSTAPSGSNGCAVGLFGSTTGGSYSQNTSSSITVAPKNVTVKLTLVAGTK